MADIGGQWWEPILYRYYFQEFSSVNVCIVQNSAVVCKDDLDRTIVDHQ